MQELTSEPATGWPVDTTSVGDTAVLRLRGDLDLLVEVPLRQVLAEALADHRHLLLDLAAVRLIDSTGLSLLVRAHQQAKRDNGVVCLVAASRFIETVLHTMRLDPVFPRFADPETALAWLAGR